MKSLTPWLCLVAAASSCAGYAADGLDAYRRGNYTAAAELLTKQAGTDPVIDYYLGRMRLYGYGQLKNNAMALRYFTQSASKGFLPAQKLLAHYYLLGANNPEQAFTWFKAAAEAKDLKAQMYCAAAYLYGLGVKKNPETAKKYYIEAAKSGDAIAQYELAIQFLESRDSSNKKLGLIWLNKSAMQNNARAQFRLGELYDAGKLLTADPVKAAELIANAAKQKYIPAMVFLAEKAKKQGNFTLAKTWLTQAVASQSLDAKVAMAKFLMDPQNPLQDYKNGFLGTLQAAQSGSLEAQEFLSLLYKEGRGVVADENLSRQWQDMALKTEASNAKVPANIAAARWLSNDKSDNFAAAGYVLGGIYNAWHNPAALKENNYNQAPRMNTVTRKALYQPKFTIVQPGEIPISEYYNVLAPLLNANPSANWTFPRYPLDRQISALLRHESKVLRHQQGVSVIDDGANWLEAPKTKIFDYLVDKTEDGEHQTNLQAVLSQMYGQAILGEPAAQFEIGQLYQYGIGIAKNIPQAITYYQLAAIQQDVRAEYNLGVLYLEGKTTPVDYQKGVNWMIDAAFKGNAYAQYVLANLYENGLKDASGQVVISPNHPQAMAMLYLASANHYPEAEYKLADFLVREKNTGLSMAMQQNRTALIKRLYSGAARQGVVEAILPLAFYHAMDNNLAIQKQAFAVAKQQADAGNSEAALLLGIMLERGITVAANQQEAISWYQKAALNPVSAFILGTYYGEGTGLEKNVVKARELLEQSGNAGFSYAHLNQAIFKQRAGEFFITDLDAAREAGNSKAGLLLADYYLQDSSNPEKIKQARDIYQYFAAKGDKEAQLKLGFIYEKGLGGEVNAEQAAQWYTAAAEQGQAVAQYLLGQLYQMGQIGTRQPDYALAKKWYTAAQPVYHPASVALGFIYDTVEDDYQHALKNYTLAADAGDPAGQYDLGLLYEYGKGRPMDLEKAKNLYSRAAGQGYSKAMTQMAGLYFRGIKGVKDQQLALEWYKNAAAAGDSGALYQLGLLSETGVALKLDYQNAVQYYQQAADKGNAKAALALARMYQYGLGVEKNYQQAADLYKTLAADNNAYAQYQLALGYLDGNSGERLPEQAKSLLQQASQNGSAQAEKMLQWMNAQQEQKTSFIEPFVPNRSPVFAGQPELLYLDALNEWNRGDEASSRMMLDRLTNQFPDFAPAKQAYQQLNQRVQASR